MRQKIFVEKLWQPHLKQSFLLPETFRNTKNFLGSETKSFQPLIFDTPSMVYRNFRAQQMEGADFELLSVYSLYFTIFITQFT